MTPRDRLPDDLERLVAQVQHNCHVADAHHAADYTMCIYLLRMREYFRWEEQAPFSDELPREAFGDWLKAREALWQDLDQADLEDLPLPAGRVSPFANDAINNELLPRGYVYSGGLGQGGVPHFFLAELIREERIGQCRLLVSGRELARDLTAPPAMALDNTIYIRRESLTRMVWERVQESHWQSAEAPLVRAAAAYPFDQDRDAALQQMTDDVQELVQWHELGEVEVGRQLGEGWETMLHSLTGSRTELLLRAVRDQLADCLITLPALLEADQAPAWHFYFGHLSPTRKLLCPGLVAAYRDWTRDGHTAALQQAVNDGAGHWRRVADEALRRHRDLGKSPCDTLQQWLESTSI